MIASSAATADGGSGAGESARARGTWKWRDLTGWTEGDMSFVLACDSNAGIGGRPSDTLAKDPMEVGYSAAKVPLMEVLSAGATPFLLVNTLGGTRDGYGRQLLAGIETAMNESGSEIALAGSDETNMPTQQTALGVTVIGRAPVGGLRLGAARPGDLIVVVGRPKDGLVVPYAEGDPDVAGIFDVRTVLGLGIAHELLPVGSRGIAFEAEQLAAGVQAGLTLTTPSAVDLSASAGASTCFLAALAAIDLDRLRTGTRLPIIDVGRIDGSVVSNGNVP